MSVPLTDLAEEEIIQEEALIGVPGKWLQANISDVQVTKIGGDPVLVFLFLYFLENA